MGAKNQTKDGVERFRSNGCAPTPSCRLLIKLALRACERSDTEGASEALRAALALDVAAPPALAVPQAVSIGELADLLDYSPRHVRTLIAEGAIPAEAVLSHGRGTRVLLEPAIEALRSSRGGSQLPVDDVEREGLEHVERRRHRRSRGGRTPKE